MAGLVPAISCAFALRTRVAGDGWPKAGHDGGSRLPREAPREKGTPMECKTGLEHIQSLKDGRTVYIDGKLVDDVTIHPAYRNAVASAALLYDYQSRPENLELMTFLPEGGTRRVSRCWQMPRDYEQLVQRRKALQAWAQVSYGFMGRSPDHVASALIGQRMGLEVFARHGPARAKALADYVDYATGNDLFLTYVIVNPQADRSKDWGDQAEDLVAQIVD
jgi:4-hydroxyphenylacetate 3-monooxygenase